MSTNKLTFDENALRQASKLIAAAMLSQFRNHPRMINTPVHGLTDDTVKLIEATTSDIAVAMFAPIFIDSANWSQEVNDSYRQLTVKEQQQYIKVVEYYKTVFASFKELGLMN